MKAHYFGVALYVHLFWLFIAISFQSNLAVEEYRVNRERFNGLSCTWYAHSGKNPSRLFHCSTSNATALLGSKVCCFT
jgi:hypothetical protein